MRSPAADWTWSMTSVTSASWSEAHRSATWSNVEVFIPGGSPDWTSVASRFSWEPDIPEYSIRASIPVSSVNPGTSTSSHCFCQASLL